MAIEHVTDAERVLAPSWKSKRGLVTIRDCGLATAAMGLAYPRPRGKPVLKPLYRVDPARSRITGGFGTGLAAKERVVKLHRGELTIADPVECGALVRITLPVV